MPDEYPCWKWVHSPMVPPMLRRFESDVEYRKFIDRDVKAHVWIFVICLIVLIGACLATAGCSYGYIKRSVERVSPSGEKYTERSEVRTPQNPTQPASMTGGDGATTQPFQASTGAGQALSQALQSMDKLVWIGAGLMVLGVGLVIVKVMFFPIIPLEAGIGLVLLGLGMTFIPGIWESYKLWVVLTIGLVVIGGASMIVWRMNKNETEKPNVGK